MQNTLYVKLRVRKSPYANKAVALRISCNYYEDFLAKDSMFVTEVSPACGQANLLAVIDRIVTRAGCATYKLNFNKEVAKLFFAES
jgi:hypothetical protein